jgi:hypothetical protein
VEENIAMWHWVRGEKQMFCLLVMFEYIIMSMLCFADDINNPWSDTWEKRWYSSACAMVKCLSVLSLSNLKRQIAQGEQLRKRRTGYWKKEPII